MTLKPQAMAGYSHGRAALAERGLLEVWRHFGKFRKHMVLVGGLVPRYLVGPPRHRGQLRHCGSLDVDLGVSLAVADEKTYASIRQRLTNSMGFVPGQNKKGNLQRHSFVKHTEDGDVFIDFLTVNYGGPKTKIRAVEKNLSAIQTDGMGLALDTPLEIVISGELLSGGKVEETIRVCRAVPFVVLKALALEDRGERKDAYDLVYTLRYYKAGPSAVAAEITENERTSNAFAHALNVLAKRFKTPTADGCEKYARFIGAELQADRTAAYAAVQEFLKGTQAIARF
ncbi:MAG: hypothetical protein ABIH24_10600 [Verrucomicrobiota bacterium]